MEARGDERLQDRVFDKNAVSIQNRGMSSPMGGARITDEVIIEL